jgi:hypothetical protein
LREFLPDFSRLADVITVIDVPGSSSGEILKVLMNADRDEAVGMLIELRKTT